MEKNQEIKSTKLKDYYEVVIKKLTSFLIKHEYLKVFLFIFVLGIIMFASRTVTNQFTLPMNGDYILQQLPFHENGYDNVWHFLKTGEFVMWSYENFIGVNYFAANTFYYLTSPFFIPILFVPRSFIPQMIYIMMLVKLATGGLLFYILLKKFFNISKEVSIIGATIYAFCGWGMYYLWFNHFADILALFPLTLIGVEYCLRRKKAWVLTIAMFLIGVTNYFFLFTFAITTPLYAIYRGIVLYKGKGFKAWFLALWQTAWCYGAGILMAGFVLIPALNVVGTTPRVADPNRYVEALLEFVFKDVTKTGASYDLGPIKELKDIFSRSNVMGFFNHVFVNNDTKRVFYPISTFLFFNITDTNSLLFNTSGYDNGVASLFITTPLALFLWPSIFDLIKNKKYFKLFGVFAVAVMLFSPITYYALHGFTTVAYARWQIFAVALSIIFILSYFDKLKTVPKVQLDLAVIINLMLAMWCVSIAFSYNLVDMEYRIYFILGQIIYIVISYIYLRFFYKFKEDEENKEEVKEFSAIKSEEITFIDKLLFNSKRTYSTLYFLIVAELLVATNATLFVHGVSNFSTLYGGQANLKELHQVVDYIKENDDGFYRIFNTEADRSYNNLQMNLYYKGLSTFHSVYNYESQDFIDKSAISYQGNWSMGVHEKRYNLETFLNVKYYIVKKGDTNIPLGYELYKEFPNHTVYINNDYLELGYAYDKVINYSSYAASSMQLYDAEANYWSSVGIYNDDLEELKPLLGSDITILDNLEYYYNSVGGSTYFLPRRTADSNITELQREKEAINNANKFSNRSQLNTLIEKVGDEYHQTNKLLGPWKDARINRDWAGDKFIYIPNTPICATANGTEESGCNVLVKFHLGPNANISLYGGANQDELITSDAHMVHNYNKDGDIKYYRGFYTTKPVTRIVIEFLNDQVFNYRLETPSVYFESYSNYKARIDALKPYALTDVKHTNNTINFKTNYDKKRFVVLSVPYNEGWHITVKDALGNVVESPKLYNVDGGLIGFIVNEGNYSYHLNYFTPGLNTGLNITYLGLAVFVVITLIYERKRIFALIKSLK